jgi:hypothetical protein
MSAPNSTARWSSSYTWSCGHTNPPSQAAQRPHLFRCGHGQPITSRARAAAPTGAAGTVAAPPALALHPLRHWRRRSCNEGCTGGCNEGCTGGCVRDSTYARHSARISGHPLLRPRVPAGAPLPSHGWQLAPLWRCRLARDMVSVVPGRRLGRRDEGWQRSRRGLLGDIPCGVAEHVRAASVTDL